MNKENTLLDKEQLVLSARQITRTYRAGSSEELDVLKGIDLDIRQGEILAIVGHSGAGKSTLLHILGALDRPTRGAVHLGGVELYSMSEARLAQFRNQHIGFVFQFHHLLPEFTAEENVAMPALIRRQTDSNAGIRARELLGLVGLEHRLSHRPRELSGGEQQRVAFARALMNDPKLILADEPSGNLDLKNSDALHRLMWDLVRETGKTFVVVTHNHQLAEEADRVIELMDGSVV